MRTKKIFYLQTNENTYLRRHDIYNAGARWDAKGKRWWSQTPGPLRKAAEMVGGGDVVAAHVQKLPKLGADHRGGRPRAPRGNGRSEAVEHIESLSVPMVQGNEPQPMLASGQPFVRGRSNEDRRKHPERRNEETRPEAVLVVPMVTAPELP